MEERLRDEVERKRATEEKLRQAVDRHKAVLTQQDRNADRLLEVQRELRRKTKELGETNEKLEAANALLEMLSITDELTGLFNRRRFNEAFTMEVRRATRYHHSLSVIMLDIDHFKEVNDTHGHPAGDIVLKRLGAILRDHLRETDLVARYGGEEFVMVLPETTLEIARTIAERLRARIENETFRTDEKELRITVSMGLVSRQGTLEAEALLAEADEALYRAKSGGRNRVELAATG
jgi:diguanylate cyclase (GGDEF)-like protein